MKDARVLSGSHLMKVEYSSYTSKRLDALWTHETILSINEFLYQIHQHPYISSSQLSSERLSVSLFGREQLNSGSKQGFL